MQEGCSVWVAVMVEDGGGLNPSIQQVFIVHLCAEPREGRVIGI